MLRAPITPQVASAILPVLPMNRVQVRFILCSSVLYRSVRKLVKSAV